MQSLKDCKMKMQLKGTVRQIRTETSTIWILYQKPWTICLKKQYCYQWEESVTEILSDIDVKVTNNDIEDCHKIGKKN